VQHKQIRPSDEQNERFLGFNDDGGHYRIPQGGLYGGRVMNLPPSGPMAVSVGWYNRSGPNGPVTNAPQDPNVGGGVNQSFSGDDQDVSPAGVTSPGTGATNASAEDVQAESDPLSTMDPLRQSLPDVGDAATSAAASVEN
jgi:hypothetical protein